MQSDATPSNRCRWIHLAITTSTFSMPNTRISARYHNTLLLIGMSLAKLAVRRIPSNIH